MRRRLMPSAPKRAMTRRHTGIEADGLRIQVNGDPREVYATTVTELVEELALDPRKVAVERNLEIVPRSLHAVTALAEGDRIELVQFVGGG
ncbi:sulfur carrier protein ThiS [Brevundimonas sp. Bb-A]|jgi:sulfur carrier protein|nr:sulfur carrier protein ThiS [Brevundimonas sp. Bb-A]